MSPSARHSRDRAARLRQLALRSAAAALLGAPALSQGQLPVQFSIDWKSQSVSRLDSSSAPRPMTEADVLAPGNAATGVIPAPRVTLTGNTLFLQGYASCLGHVGGTPCQIDVDALSGGDDALLRLNQPRRPRILFSVDEWASGHPRRRRLRCTPACAIRATRRCRRSVRACSRPARTCTAT